MTGLVETEIGTIAPDWTVRSLEEVCEQPQYGYTASAEEKGNVHFLRITDITDSGVKWPSVPFCECPEELLDKFLLASGDIVFARIGATTGKSYLITSPPPSVFASYLIRIRVKRDINAAFLSQFFRSVAYWRQVDAQKNANLKKGVSGSLLKKLLVPLPPLPDQRKIAAVLGLIQRAIELQERLIALTTELKKTLLHQLFTQGLRGEPQKQSEIGPVPESWEVVRLDSLFRIQQGKQVSKKNRIGDNQRPFLRTKNIFWGRLDLSELDEMHFTETEEKRLTLKPGDLLVCEGGDIGRTAIWNGELAACYHQNHLHRVRAVNSKNVEPAFLMYWLWYAFEFGHLYFGRGNVTTIPNLSQSRLAELPIPYTELNEQREIVAALDALSAKEELHKRKLALLSDIFRTLLHQLMTAQIRVHNLDLSEIEDRK